MINPEAEKGRNRPPGPSLADLHLGDNENEVASAIEGAMDKSLPRQGVIALAGLGIHSLALILFGLYSPWYQLIALNLFLGWAPFVIFRVTFGLRASMRRIQGKPSEGFWD